MKKDAYFFPHYCNARHDRKLKRVIKELGVEGYGIYFMLLEVLREQIDFKYPLEDLDLLADEFGTSEQKVRTVITNYKLFDVDDQERFFSMKLVFYLQPYIEKSERARVAANTRWKKVKLELTDANALPEQSNSTTDAMQGEESKGEETKVNKSKGEEIKQTIKNSDAFDEVLEFHKSLINLPKFIKLTNARKSSVMARISDYGIETVKETLEKANESKFLQGTNDRCWKPDFDWIYNPNNFVKILEGKYSEQKPLGGNQNERDQFYNAELEKARKLDEREIKCDF